MIEKLLFLHTEGLSFIKIHFISVYIFGISLFGLGELVNELAPYAGNASIIMGSIVLLITLATKIEDYVTTKINQFKKRKRAKRITEQKNGKQV
jgi:hypothetical protein